MVNARDAAILKTLKAGPCPFAALKDAIPDEPGMTEDQKVRACSNALTRLRLKKEIHQTGDGWAIA